MSFSFLRRFCVLFTLFLCAVNSKAQTSYTFNITPKNEDCTKGYIALQIVGLLTTDTLETTWSNGQTNALSISNLDAGDYNVHVVIKNKKDTTIAVTIDKDKCKVILPNHFTPNGDAYNDIWSVGNTHYYPKFELYVFNKWGQQVHSQRGTYEPWDGKWNGVNVPDGTYYYVFYYDGGNKRDLEKGDVTILR